MTFRRLDPHWILPALGISVIAMFSARRAHIPQTGDQLKLPTCVDTEVG